VRRFSRVGYCPSLAMLNATDEYITPNSHMDLRIALSRCWRRALRGLGGFLHDS